MPELRLHFVVIFHEAKLHFVAVRLCQGTCIYKVFAQLHPWKAQGGAQGGWRKFLVKKGIPIGVPDDFCL